jgi:hypothetical protein
MAVLPGRIFLLRGAEDYISFKDTLNGICVYADYIYITSDGGVSWTGQFLDYEYFGVQQARVDFTHLVRVLFTQMMV